MQSGTKETTDTNHGGKKKLSNHNVCITFLLLKLLFHEGQLLNMEESCFHIYDECDYDQLVSVNI